jgi:capsid protein
MDISIEELNALTENTSNLRLRIAELESKVTQMQEQAQQKDVENQMLKAENKQLKEQGMTLDIENNYLRNMLHLSTERIIQFMKRVSSMDRWSLLRAFVEWTLPEKNRKEQLALVDEVMMLPKPVEDKPSVLMENPTFQGPMYDVHDNDEVKLDE